MFLINLKHLFYRFLSNITK